MLTTRDAALDARFRLLRQHAMSVPDTVRHGARSVIFEEYPEVGFIIPHLGSFADDWRAHLAVIDQLVRHPNMYTDTSGVRRFDFLVETVRRAGPAKVLFGSDGPWLHPGLELAKVRALGLPSSDERLVVGANLLRLISRVGRPVDPIPTAPAAAPGRGDVRDPWAGEQFPSG